jgi:hypothetical protein
MKYKCKKTYFDENSLNAIFIKGEFYDGCYEWTTELFHIDTRIPNRTTKSFKTYAFSEFFITIDEHRELEIDKILDIDE